MNDMHNIFNLQKGVIHTQFHFFCLVLKLDYVYKLFIVDEIFCDEKQFDLRCAAKIYVEKNKCHQILFMILS